MSPMNWFSTNKWGCKAWHHGGFQGQLSSAPLVITPLGQLARCSWTRTQVMSIWRSSLLTSAEVCLVKPVSYQHFVHWIIQQNDFFVISYYLKWHVKTIPQFYSAFYGNLSYDVMMQTDCFEASMWTMPNIISRKKTKERGWNPG